MIFHPFVAILGSNATNSAAGRHNLAEFRFINLGKGSKILVLGGLGKNWKDPSGVINKPSTQDDSYETMPSEIFDIATGKSISIGKSWKRKNGVHPKDYLFPLLIPTDTLYCTDSSSWPTTTTSRFIGDPAIFVLAQQPILFNPATGEIFSLKNIT